MNNIITKNHCLYGQVRFILDSDDKYKPIAKDILPITGNNTNINYGDNSLLERRELYSLIESSTNDLELFEDWLYINYDNINHIKNNISFKNEAEILANVTLDDFAEINIHPFSCNSMYDSVNNKFLRSNKYNAWWECFPTDSLKKFIDVDFNKPVFVWYYFKHLDSFDTENLLKPTSDRICDYFATTDTNFKHFKIDSDPVEHYSEGKIYVFICNVEKETRPF